MKEVVGTLGFIALCHSVIVEPSGGLSASSPDELALVEGVRELGFKFVSRDKDDNIEIEVLGKKKIYKVLHFIEFNSDRKRMSVIITDPNNEVTLLCKGADSIIESLLTKEAQTSEKLVETKAAIERWAATGLRTLMLASKTIDQSYYLDWDERLEQALEIMTEEKEAKLDELYNEIEREFDLVGSTAIEDKLQDECKETIEAIRTAEIKLWVLTGDKIETAINIGYQVGVVDQDMQLYRNR